MKEVYKAYLENFMADFDFPEEARMELITAFENVFSIADNVQALTNVLEVYKANKKESVSALLPFGKQVADSTGANIYAVYALALIIMTKISKIHYQAEQIPLEIWKNNFLDLKYKLYECKLVKGVWGNFVPDWYFGFFAVERFAFGKLQFECIEFGQEYNKNSLSLTPKNTVINIHIPRTGTGLTPQDVDEACEKAAEFFREKYAVNPIVFVCHSWLLYPANKKILKPTSNLYSFLSRFDIVSEGEYADYKETWRLFDCEYTGDAAKLPADTSFRRAYVDRIKRGEKTGWGYGVFAYQPKE